MKKITVLIAALLSCACAFAFDWKPQTNEQLRNDMFRFVEEFRNSTPDKALTKELDAFLKTQKSQAGTKPYAWIQDTHDFVDRMLDKFPAELSDGGRCSSERRNLLLLRDYPMHADNKPKDAPEQLKEAYVNSVKGLYAAAESDALRWLSKGRKSKKLEMFKTYNMGFLFRSADKVVAVDVQWSGSDAQMDEGRLAAEVVIFADKICTDEETVRLRSHIEHMKSTFEATEGIGRKLDFIAQEMNREANTILSKANDLETSNYAIDLKTGIEKVREQIQNIE